ncbi:MAG: hypothetical protein IPP74_11140 [Alphaproteobacteria bacterium]|nr:hypothetical protein [Alphaproteobacteria bacterium]
MKQRLVSWCVLISACVSVSSAYAGYEDMMRGKTLTSIRAEERAKNPPAEEAPVPRQLPSSEVPAQRPAPQNPPTHRVLTIDARSPEMDAKKQAARDNWNRYLKSLTPEQRKVYENRIADTNPYAQQAKRSLLSTPKPTPASIHSLPDADQALVRKFINNDKKVVFKDLSPEARRFVRYRYSNNYRIPPTGLDDVDFSKPLPANIYWQGIAASDAEEVRRFMQSGSQDTSTLSRSAKRAFDRAQEIRDFVDNLNNPLHRRRKEHELAKGSVAYKEQQMHLRNQRIRELTTDSQNVPLEQRETPDKRTSNKAPYPITTEMYNKILSHEENKP